MIPKKTARSTKKKAALKVVPVVRSSGTLEAQSPTLPSPRVVGKVGPLPHEVARRMAQARRRALSEWRGVDMAPAETAWRDAAQSAGSILPTVLERLNLEQRLAESQILQVWDRVMDRTITAHAKPVGLRKGTLFVTVDSNVWLSELVRYRYREMLEKLQLSVGPDKVERLSMRVG